REFVIRVLVPDGNAVVPVFFDDVIAEATVAHSPAQEQADIAVVMHAAVLDHGIGAARSGMNAVAGLPVGLAIHHVHVFRNLERDAVAIVVLRHTAIDRYIAHVVHIDGAAAAAIEIRILHFVPVHDEVFKGDVLHVHGAQNREGVANARVFLFAVVV